jgi:hypothetical protein
VKEISKKVLHTNYRRIHASGLSTDQVGLNNTLRSVSCQVITLDLIFFLLSVMSLVCILREDTLE